LTKKKTIKMGLFNKIFKSTSEAENSIKISWIALTSIEQLEALILQSSLKPALIFKHSTRCGISRMALKSFERDYNLNEENIDLYFLDLLNFRNISNAISVKLNVQHQSPQAIAVKNEHVIYHDSHYQISIDAVKKALNK